VLSLVEYQWTINDSCVFLTSWQQNDWETRFRSKQYTLSDLCTQSTSLNRILMIQHLRILSFEFFNFVSQFESIYYAVWSTQFLTVKFFSDAEAFLSNTWIFVSWVSARARWCWNIDRYHANDNRFLIVCLSDLHHHHKNSQSHIVKLISFAVRLILMQNMTSSFCMHDWDQSSKCLYSLLFLLSLRLVIQSLFFHSNQTSSFLLAQFEDNEWMNDLSISSFVMRLFFFSS